jgi:hypothetical protein
MRAKRAGEVGGDARQRGGDRSFILDHHLRPHRLSLGNDAVVNLIVRKIQ